VNTAALAGLQVFAIPGIPINAGFRFHDLQDFDEVGTLSGTVAVHLDGLVDNLTLGLAGAVGMSQVDDTDLAFGGGLWLAYPVGNIVPRLDLWYMSGWAYNYNYGLNHTWGYVDHGDLTFNSDQSYLSIRPMVQIRATATSWLQLGAVINLELGDVGAAGGDSDDSVSFGVFAGVRATF